MNQGDIMMGMTQEEIDAAFAAGLAPDQIQQMMDQRAQAEALRDTPTPGMRGNYRVQSAANPLEHLSASLNRGIGARRVKDTNQRIEEALANMGQNRQTAAQGAARAMGQLQQQVPGAQVPGPFTPPPRFRSA